MMFLSNQILQTRSSAPTDHSLHAEQGQSVLVLETGEDEHLNPLTRWGYFFPSVNEPS